MLRVLYESGILTQLFYGGVAACMLRGANARCARLRLRLAGGR